MIMNIQNLAVYTSYCMNSITGTILNGIISRKKVVRLKIIIEVHTMLWTLDGGTLTTLTVVLHTPTSFRSLLKHKSSRKTAWCTAISSDEKTSWLVIVINNVLRLQCERYAKGRPALN